ncbi:MAG TPA: bifunctional DNA-formamidopyrimidine glycosylase/DNA-(apurinic or apyrimidinic site) lyase [Terriglobales bacterium]|nr:bifunctional DNA-formamidopyrimidine glycosylase/DNA-(apurinic or apyrimidinic site) lyase [Terriglobales bacterium]
MPELPEVETVATGLHRRVAGDVIESVWLGDKPQTFKSEPEEIAATIEGTRIRMVRRVGKHIVVDLEPLGKRQNELRQWIVHLGMTGRFLVVDAAAEIVKHTHAIAKLKSGRELRFVDPRRFGRLAVVREGAGFAGPGTEPLTVSPEDFAQLFRGRKTPIKAALLNQKLLHGVGNIYADESLFRAGVRPTRQAGRLKRDELVRLHQELVKVLRAAIKAGGTTVSDYVDSDGAAGFFQFRLRAYGRTGEPCVKCKTPIKRIVVGGRSTHYCPRCQK